MSDVDYYDILDIRPTATVEEIRTAYYRAVKSAHPDAGGTAGMFRLVSEAYRTLADPQRRADYDARAGHSRGAGGGTESAEPPEPDWGEEVSWEAEPSSEGQPDAPSQPGEPTSADEFVDRQFAKLDRWMLSGNGRTAMRWATLAAAVVYAALTYIVIAHPGLVRPEAAGPDAWGGLLENTSVLRFVLIAYAVLALGGYVGVLWIPLAAVHALTLVGLIAWPIAYWGMATGTERLAFVGVFVLWLAYCAAMSVVPLLRGYRYQEGAEAA